MTKRAIATALLTLGLLPFIVPFSHAEVQLEKLRIIDPKVIDNICSDFIFRKRLFVHNLVLAEFRNCRAKVRNLILKREREARWKQRDQIHYHARIRPQTDETLKFTKRRVREQLRNQQFQRTVVQSTYSKSRERVDAARAQVAARRAAIKSRERFGREQNVNRNVRRSLYLKARALCADKFQNAAFKQCVTKIIGSGDPLFRKRKLEVFPPSTTRSPNHPDDL